ncbi:MAG: glycosyltransferase family 9 protein [Tagaea sp.]
MRALFVTSNRIGDAVLTSGVLGHLLDAHPGLRTTIACGPAAAPLFEAVPAREATIALAKAPLKAHWFALWAQCLPRVWDIVVDMRGSGLAWFLAAKKRAILSGRDDARHRVEDAARVLGLSPAPSPRLWLTDSAKARARALTGDGPLLVLGATANWPGKVWPAANFVELARRLLAGPLAGARVAIVGGPSERALAEPLLREGALDLVGTEDLGVVAAAIARATLYVGNDSGLMHVAAASGVPTLGLFGPSEDRHFRPWGPNAAFVRTPESKAELFAKIEFQPRHAQGLMDSLSVDTVEAAAVSLLARAPARAA